MKELSQNELAALAMMLERGIKHEQIRIGVDVRGPKNHEMYPITSFMTEDIFGTRDNGDSIEVILPAKSLKWLWVRYAGYLGGAKKAANAKKRDRAR